MLNQPPKNHTISVIGTGRMGYALVERLLDLGYEVCVYNRTRSKAEPLAESGAKIVETGTQAIGDSDLILVLVSDANAIRGILSSMGSKPSLRQKVFVVFSTVASEDSEQLNSWVVERGGTYIEAPVMGGPSDILEGNPTIMVGASEEDFRVWGSFLETIAGELCWTGPVGSAAVLKLALNQFMAALVAALSTSVALVQSADIPVDTLMSILKHFPYYAPSYDSKLPRMLSGDFSDPKFTIEMMSKDVSLMVRELQRRGVYPGTLKSIQKLYKRASEDGHGQEDYSAIFKVIRGSD
jgi:3-hydroxyisobutyrate dehydrogenase